MITYNRYVREDGVMCSAIQFHGGGARGAEHIFETLEVLNAADLRAKWIDQRVTEEVAVDETGFPILNDQDELTFVIEPEYILVEASKEALKVGDYIVMREGDTYLMDGPTFEAIWSLEVSTLTDLGEFLQSRKEIES